MHVCISPIVTDIMCYSSNHALVRTFKITYVNFEFKNRVWPAVNNIVDFS